MMCCDSAFDDRDRGAILQLMIDKILNKVLIWKTASNSLENKLLPTLLKIFLYASQNIQEIKR